MEELSPNSNSKFASQVPRHQLDADDDDENVKQLRECSSLYLSLQDCLINNDRNWKSCQKEVQALRACSEKKRRDEEPA